MWPTRLMVSTKKACAAPGSGNAMKASSERGLARIRRLISGSEASFGPTDNLRQRHAQVLSGQAQLDPANQQQHAHEERHRKRERIANGWTQTNQHLEPGLNQAGLQNGCATGRQTESADLVGIHPGMRRPGNRWPPGYPPPIGASPQKTVRRRSGHGRTYRGPKTPSCRFGQVLAHFVVVLFPFTSPVTDDQHRDRVIRRGQEERPGDVVAVGAEAHSFSLSNEAGRSSAQVLEVLARAKRVLWPGHRGIGERLYRCWLSWSLPL